MDNYSKTGAIPKRIKTLCGCGLGCKISPKDYADKDYLKPAKSKIKEVSKTVKTKNCCFSLREVAEILTTEVSEIITSQRESKSLEQIDKNQKPNSITEKEPQTLGEHESWVNKKILQKYKANEFSNIEPASKINHRLISNLVMERKLLQDRIRSLEFMLSNCACTPRVKEHNG
jgi:hypothetical protein